jgi:hypothetical protein
MKKTKLQERVEEINESTHERWKVFYNDITLEQALECNRIACLNLNGVYSEGHVEDYIEKNNIKQTYE